MKLKKSRKQQTVRFLHRSVLFFTFFSIGLFIFYVFGNIQYFIDSTQEMLLQFLSIVSVSLMVLSIVTFCTEIVFFIRMKTLFYLLLSLVSFFSFILGIVGSILSRSILILSQGIS